MNALSFYLMFITHLEWEKEVKLSVRNKLKEYISKCDSILFSFHKLLDRWKEQQSCDATTLEVWSGKTNH